MRRYDNVYVPAISSKETDYYMDKEGDLFRLTELPDRFVLTIEELRELWMMAKESGAKLMIPGTKIQNVLHFEAFMESKGITI